MARVEFWVNGKKQAVEASAGESLLAALRDRLDLTGAKYGCGEGQCGACTVLVDGKAVSSCITPVAKVAGRKVTTIEGLSQGKELHPIQQAFLDTAAFQCGYCTPGMILGGVALLAEKPNPTEQDVKQGLNGHICRCGTYPRIVEAVRQAARHGGRR